MSDFARVGVPTKHFSYLFWNLQAHNTIRPRHGKLQQLMQQPGAGANGLAQQNRQLKDEVHTLESEVQTMSAAMKRMTGAKSAKLSSAGHGNVKTQVILVECM